MDPLDNKFYHRGKTARAAGKKCVLSDARLNVENRSAWFQGWHAQDSHESQKTADSQERADFEANVGDFLGALKDI